MLISKVGKGVIVSVMALLLMFYSLSSIAVDFTHTKIDDTDEILTFDAKVKPIVEHLGETSKPGVFMAVMTIQKEGLKFSCNVVDRGNLYSARLKKYNNGCLVFLIGGYPMRVGVETLSSDFGEPYDYIEIIQKPNT